MGKVTGFMEYAREAISYRPIAERVRDFCEVILPASDEQSARQAARCMDCGVPFCHAACPLNNRIPDFNDLVFKGRWRDAYRALSATNNFPEFTSRLCPAPCEPACVLDLHEAPVSVKVIERSIIERAFTEGWVKPEPPSRRTGKRIAVVGSGPAGLAAAQQLNRAGHTVVVLEKADACGGLLRYGIPDFKLDKALIDRRLRQLGEEGVTFQLGAHAGQGAFDINGLQQRYDVVLLAMGAAEPRDLEVPGRTLAGVHFALEFLGQQNRRQAGLAMNDVPVSAAGRRVVIIGGGDTGADCLGTCLRQGAASVRQLEITPMPPRERAPETPWPAWPRKLRTESSHEEGGVRDYGIATLGFEGDGNGSVRGLHAVRVGPPPGFAPLAGTEFTLECDLVLLAMGFFGPTRAGPIHELGLRLDARGNVATSDFMTSVVGVFATGDMRRGQSLVVTAIAEGRRAAEAIDRFLG